jgi:hypothetical protein
MRLLALRTMCLAVLSLAMPSAALAQRELHWDGIEVSAHLGAAGDLQVTETQTMVFSGEWNGGERRFTIRPRQKLSFVGLFRGGSGGWQRLTEDSRLNDVDEYTWTNGSTLRWRSRRPSDPPFANTAIHYQLRYILSAVLLKEADGYRLNHDFAFADRDGIIDRFVLRLTYDPAWQPMSDVREVYTAGPLSPGESFVLNLSMRHAGAQIPATLNLTRPPEIMIAVSLLLGLTALAVLWFFAGEQSSGRFEPLATGRVDEAWLREHILKYPAEVIGAAWDGSIGNAEVIALIARMVAEGKLGSDVQGEGRESSMALTLRVDRTALEGHERTLVERLFFDGLTETSTELVKAHYHDQGFYPANEIRPELEAAVARLLPVDDPPGAFTIASLVLFVVGVGALVVAWLQGNLEPIGTLVAVMVWLVVAGIGWAAGIQFRAHIDWGRPAALACLMPALILAAATARSLWFYAGEGGLEFTPVTVVGVVALVLALINASINSLRSRQSRDTIAFRKALIAGRGFFISELRKERPALRDEWYPWLLAFGLANEVENWSTQRSVAAQRTVTEAEVGPRWSSDVVSPAPPAEEWSGFGGGRSGGAGGGASWAAAADGMAAGVSVVSVASTVNGGSSSGYSDYGGSSGGGASSGVSSGGGGGGGW